MIKIIMHKNCMDVAFHVFKMSKYSPNKITIKGRWLNLGYTGNPWYVSSITSFDVKNEDFNNWINITNKVHKIRVKSGVPE